VGGVPWLWSTPTLVGFKQTLTFIKGLQFSVAAAKKRDNFNTITSIVSNVHNSGSEANPTARTPGLTSPWTNAPTLKVSIAPVVGNGKYIKSLRHTTQTPDGWLNDAAPLAPDLAELPPNFWHLEVPHEQFPIILQHRQTIRSVALIPENKEVILHLSQYLEKEVGAALNAKNAAANQAKVAKSLVKTQSFETPASAPASVALSTVNEDEVASDGWAGSRKVTKLDRKTGLGGGGIAGSGSGVVLKKDDGTADDLTSVDIQSIFDTLLPTDLKLGKLFTYFPSIAQLIFNDLAVTAAPDSLLKSIVMMRSESLRVLALTTGTEGSRISYSTVRYIWERCACLRELRLEGIDFSGWNTTTCNISKPHLQLERLVFRECSLPLRDTQISDQPPLLPHLLPLCPNLNLLDLVDVSLCLPESDNQSFLWEAALAVLSEYLPSKIQHFRVSWTHPVAYRIPQRFFSTIVQRCPKLRTLHIDGIRGISPLSPLLSQSLEGLALSDLGPNLNSLTLSHTHTLNDEDLLSVVKHAPNLIRLIVWVEEGSFTNISLIAIAEKLPRLYTLAITSPSQTTFASNCNANNQLVPPLTEKGLKAITDGCLYLKHFVPPKFQDGRGDAKYEEGAISFELLIQALLGKLRRRGCRVWANLEDIPEAEVAPAFIWTWGDL
jgi:hypothetical protein